LSQNIKTYLLQLHLRRRRLLVEAWHGCCFKGQTLPEHLNLSF
jgi:hypothetical protein